MKNATQNVLEKLVLFAATTRIIGVEREAGGGQVYGKSRKGKVVQSVINPKKLAGFKQIKSEMFRLCRTYGTRIDVLDAWGVPVDDAEHLTENLTRMASKWELLTEEAQKNWEGWVNDWCRENTEYAASIRELAPSVEQVGRKTKFIFASYRLSSDQIDSGSLDCEFESLPEQAAHEISAQIRETYPDIGRDSWDEKPFRAVAARNLLQLVARKAKGLGFLHKQLDEMPKVIDTLLLGLPTTGMIEGLQAIGLRSIFDQLTQPQDVLRKGIRLPRLGADCIEEDIDTSANDDFAGCSVKVPTQTPLSLPGAVVPFELHKEALTGKQNVAATELAPRIMTGTYDW